MRDTNSRTNTNTTTAITSLISNTTTTSTGGSSSAQVHGQDHGQTITGDDNGEMNSAAGFGWSGQILASSLAAASSDIDNHQCPYQTILAQRSVARAALHLGIDTLPQNTLTVLQDALTHFLERVGRVMGNNVEMGGRASDHVNVLDAIRAVEDCSLRSLGSDVSRSEGDMGDVVSNGNGIRDGLMNGVMNGIGDGSASGNGAMNGHEHGHGNGIANSSGIGGIYGDWSDLARFLFGDNFMHASDPNTTGHSRQDGESDTMGWNAPLDDYDSMPLFPIHLVGQNGRARTLGISDDHGILPSGGIGGDDDGAQKKHDPSLTEKDSSPSTNGGADAAPYWGTGAIAGAGSTSSTEKQNNGQPTTSAAMSGASSAATSRAPSPAIGISNIDKTKLDKNATASKAISAKRKRDENSSDTGDNKRSKNTEANSGKSKLGTNGAGAGSGDQQGNISNDDKYQEHIQLPSYIPQFLPPFPPKHTYSKSTRPITAAVGSFEVQDVRTSLVQFGQSYWGQMAPTAVSSKSTTLAKVDTASIDINAVDFQAPGRAIQAGVKPVAKASNARISRILEGSLDVHS